jgi:hypothetical protein
MHVNFFTLMCYLGKARSTDADGGISHSSGGEDEDDDVGALIYREVQLLRKTEAAAKPHLQQQQRPIRRTSNQKRSPVNNQRKESLSRPQR